MNKKIQNEETKQKIRLIKKFLFEGKTFEEIQKEFKKMKIAIRDIADFIKERPEDFKEIGFVRRR